MTSEKYQKEEIQAQLDLTTEQKDTISRQNEKMLDSIQYAEKIQSALLPPTWYFSEVMSEHFILFRPRDIVSGDFYWTSFRQGKLVIAVADCTGHGVPGAFLSVLGIASMNEIINRASSLSCGEFLEQLRDTVIHTLHQTGEKGEAQDGFEIALCLYDPVARTLEFSGANRPLYVIHSGDQKKGGAKSITQIRGDRMPIGIYEKDPEPFTDHLVQLNKGDSFYLFSDGYVDQLGGENRKTFRAVHFRKLLEEIHTKPMDEQRKILLKKHEEWKGEVEQIDDILVMGFRV
jgi:serine phosphatase RsbU (regulator of sigma subunit)